MTDDIGTLLGEDLSNLPFLRVLPVVHRSYPAGMISNGTFGHAYMMATMAKHTAGAPSAPHQNFGVWISRDEWKKQQVELKRGAEAYNQLLQVRPCTRAPGLTALCCASSRARALCRTHAPARPPTRPPRPPPRPSRTPPPHAHTITSPCLHAQEIEKKDRNIEALRTQCTEHLESRRHAEQQVCCSCSACAPPRVDRSRWCACAVDNVQSRSGQGSS